MAGPGLLIGMMGFLPCAEAFEPGQIALVGAGLSAYTTVVLILAFRLVA